MTAAKFQRQHSGIRESALHRYAPHVLVLSCLSRAWVPVRRRANGRAPPDRPGSSPERFGGVDAASIVATVSRRAVETSSPVGASRSAWPASSPPSRGGAHRRSRGAADSPAVPGQDRDRSSVQGADLAAANAVDGNNGTRWGSQLSDPAVAPGRPRRQRDHQSVGLQLGRRVRQGVQDPDVGQRHHLDRHLHHHHRRRRHETLTVTGTGRYVRMYGTVRGTGYGYSLYEFQVYGNFGTTPTTPDDVARHRHQRRPGQAGDRLVAPRTPRPTPASAAVDGNAGTRWASQFSDPQWLRSTSAARRAICQVVAAVGGGLRQGVPDPGVQRRRHLDHDLHHHHRHRRHPDADTSPAPAATCGCTAPPASTATATRCGSSRSSRRRRRRPTTPTTPATGTRPGNWTTVWTEDFNGAANTTPSAANWLLRTGTQYPGGAANWGTGEVETASASTANVYLDGSGKLEHQGDPRRRRRWTSGRIETQRTDFAAERRRAGASSPPSSSSPTWPTGSATGRASGPPAPPTAATSTTGRASARPTS